MASLKEQVLQGFKNAGLSLNQARILAAEVGRENSFDPNVIFGVHSDPENNKTNVGMLSWQNGREVPLLKSLKSNGLIENGKIKQSQNAIDLMARYAVHEIRTKPEYAETKKHFLENPNVPYKDAVKVLGRNFIRWRFDDPQYSSGHTNRDEFYSQLGGNPARQEYQDRSAQIVAAYKAKQKEQERKAQAPKDTGRTQKIVAAYQKARQDGRIQDATNQPQGLPDFDAQGNIIQPTAEQQPQSQPKTTLGQDIIGAGETALTLGTGAISAPIASVVGTLGQAGREIVGGDFGSPEAAQRIAQAAEQAGQGYTYQPRTQAGREQLQAVGEVLSPLESLPPVIGGLGVQSATLGKSAIPQGVVAAQRTGQAVAPLVEQATQAAQRPIQAAKNAVRTGAQSVREAVGMGRATDNAAPANIGAAQVDQATVRQALAQDLPYPPQLTEGQLSRDPAQLKFEVETSKDPELGVPLRQRQEEQHQVMQQNIDAFIDMTGAKATNMREVGLAVDSALQKQMQADKNRVRVAYAKADRSEEAMTPVDLTQPVKTGDNEAMSVIDYLNSQPELPTTPILTSAKRTAESLGIAKRGENGELIPNSPTIKQMEKWRQEINANTNQEAPNIRQTAILKDMIDQHVGPVEGALYKAARNERKRMARHWESNAIIKDLTTKKAGTEDRKVALEDVQKRIIYDGSLDDLRTARRALLTSGEEGKQAWKDIQGQTLQEIKDTATSGVAPDAQGNQMISPAALNKAIRRLDDDGKLDFIFGQQGAEKIRALNDISKTLFTQPASAGVNHSNTAATLMAALDITMSGLSGFPAPVASALRIATKHIKDNKIRARVQKALNPKGKSI
ncbi:hypothetical protein [Acinetobacter junii]|uniref:hypothetical protein n=1 Tax=Acinetobacter junii TaxID=40215 RepID=UPI00124ED3B6|nr:hypothetical protein [Acinetobacter junii]